MAAHLLIVDDDLALSALLSRHFADHGYHVSAAPSCREALAIAALRLPDLALLDYQLPDGDGIRLLQQLRALAPGLAVVMMSGAREPGAADRARRAGAFAWLVKPVPLDELERVLASAGGR